MMRFWKLLRIQTPAILLAVAFGGLAGGKGISDISFALFSIFFLMLGLWSLDNYVDRDVDMRLHPGRGIPSGAFTPEGVFRTSLFFLTVSIIIPAVKFMLLGGVILLALICLAIVLGFITINVRKITRNINAQELIKASLVGALVGLLLPIGGGFGRGVITLGVIVGIFHVANTATSDLQKAEDGLSQNHKPSEKIIFSASALYLLAALIVWVPCYCNIFRNLCFVPTLLLSVSAAVLGGTCLIGGTSTKIVKWAAVTGKASVISILVIEALSL